jgi:hypothetical protein
MLFEEMGWLRRREPLQGYMEIRCDLIVRGDGLVILRHHTHHIDQVRRLDARVRILPARTTIPPGAISPAGTGARHFETLLPI